MRDRWTESMIGFVIGCTGIVRALSRTGRDRAASPRREPPRPDRHRPRLCRSRAPARSARSASRDPSSRTSLAWCSSRADSLPSTAHRSGSGTEMRSASTSTRPRSANRSGSTGRGPGVLGLQRDASADGRGVGVESMIMNAPNHMLITDVPTGELAAIVLARPPTSFDRHRRDVHRCSAARAGVRRDLGRQGPDDASGPRGRCVRRDRRAARAGARESERLRSVLHATTLATNAVIERKERARRS